MPPDQATRPLRRFRPEAELLLWSARTELLPEVRERFVERVREGVDWAALFRLAKYHGVAPLLIRHVSALCPASAPGELYESLRRHTQAGLVLNRVLAQELVVLMEAFASHGVPAIPFKGVALALSAYRDLALRDFDDLDFIVPRTAMARAESVLRSRGYRSRDRGQDPVEACSADDPYHVFVKKGSLSRVDLQWVMAQRHFAFELDRPDCWRRMTSLIVQGRAIPTLAPEEMLIILCVHGSKHAWEQLKWVCDVAELLRHEPTMDWEQVFARASAWGCRRMLSMGLELARRLLDASLPAAVQQVLDSDPDVPALALRMPSSLLTRPQDGITEKDAVALYFVLKDSWWERWRFGLGLCCEKEALVTHAPSWFRWQDPLQRLNSVVRPLHAVAAKCVPSSAARRAIGRWLQPAA